MSDSLKLAMQLADDIEQFPLGKFGPSDDARPIADLHTHVLS
jgi:hypothetical protein